MNWAQHLQRLMGAVIIMIACLVVSPAAFAHTGHGHSDRAGISAPAIDVVIQVAEDSAIVVKAKAGATSQPQAPERCIGGCCTSSHTCCAADLPLNAGLFDVPFTSAIRTFREPPLRYGLDPEALRKPPRSFA
jgi:hypothetical protein